MNETPTAEDDEKRADRSRSELQMFTGVELLQAFGGITKSFQAIELILEIDHMKWSVVKNRFSNSFDVICGSETIACDLTHYDADRLVDSHNQCLTRLMDRVS